MMQTPALLNRPSLRPDVLPLDEIDGLYVHVPFCFHKCHYCDFYSITRQSADRMGTFVDRVLREAALWTASRPVPVRPATVFFGGGTPSLLPLAEMQRLLTGLQQIFDLSNADEWTIEINPATASTEYCAMLRAEGVNRLSFGAQSFRREDLAALERHHDPDDVPRSLDMARAAGFERLNIDLIFAIPGQSPEAWRGVLEQAISLGLSHLSCYGLTYESNTPMGVKKRMGLLRPAAEDAELEMLSHTRARLREAGLLPYEISNYAAPGQACRHNLMYWRGQNYVGLGPSAASHVSGHRWKNRAHLGEWESAIDNGELPAAEVEALSPRQRTEELAMLMLRLADGIDRDHFKSLLNIDPIQEFAAQIAHLGDMGFLHISPTHISLTETAIPVADAVAVELVR